MSRKVMENLKIFLITIGVMVLVGGADSIGDMIF